MRDSGQSEQDQMLRRMEVGSTHEELDVTPLIMHKVRQIHQKKHGKSNGYRKKSFIPVLVTAILILSSLSVYAGNYLIQIKNKEGKVVLSTIKPWKYTESEYNVKRVKESEEELSEILKTGEQAVYYIKDQHLTSSSQKYPLKYYYKATKHPNYEELAKEIEKKGAPLLQEPEYVPEGYRFDFGRININNYPILGTPEYESLLDELKMQAEKSDEEQGLFYRILPGAGIASTGMEYRKGEHRITILAFAREKGKKAGVPSNEVIILTVKGRERIFSNDSTTETRSLTWLSDSEEVLYVIRDDPKDPLSKEEFAKIAAGLKTE
ncbi:hypothetical protein [Paenibacillus solani]|uniref:hypothetical protein n=1 Tax=Paenibacillus solani TaxID=1705565 RepID=UPI003D27C4EE